MQPRRTLLQGLGLSSSTTNTSASASDLQKLVSERSGSAQLATGSDGNNALGASRQVVSTGGEVADRRPASAHRRAQSWSLFRVRTPRQLRLSVRCMRPLPGSVPRCRVRLACVAATTMALLIGARARAAHNGAHESRAQ